MMIIMSSTSTEHPTYVIFLAKYLRQCPINSKYYPQNLINYRLKTVGKILIGFSPIVLILTRTLNQNYQHMFG